MAILLSIFFTSADSLTLLTYCFFLNSSSSSIRAISLISAILLSESSLTADALSEICCSIKSISFWSSPSLFFAASHPSREGSEEWSVSIATGSLSISSFTGLSRLLYFCFKSSRLYLLSSSKISPKSPEKSLSQTSPMISPRSFLWTSHFNERK